MIPPEFLDYGWNIPAKFGVAGNPIRKDRITSRKKALQELTTTFVPTFSTEVAGALTTSVEALNPRLADYLNSVAIPTDQILAPIQ